jgi:hypothetical protein
MKDTAVVDGFAPILSTLWTTADDHENGTEARCPSDPACTDGVTILAAGRESGVPLAEVVQATGLTRPTLHRIVHVLIEEGIVERHEKTGRYAIGGQVPESALARPRVPHCSPRQTISWSEPPSRSATRCS